jgi:hypothetical protein
MLMPEEPPTRDAFVLDQVEDQRDRLLGVGISGRNIVRRKTFEIRRDAALADAFGDGAAGGFQFAVV